MKSPFEKFQHFVHNFGRRGSGNRHSSQLDTLGYFGALLGRSGPFWVLFGPSGMESPIAKFQHFLRHIGRRRSGNPYSSLLDISGYFGDLLVLSGPF